MDRIIFQLHIFPWAQIRDLELRGLSTVTDPSIYRILEHCPNLSSLTYDCADWDPSVDEYELVPNEIKQTSYLRHLTIDLWRSFYEPPNDTLISLLLSSLTLPAVESIIIRSQSRQSFDVFPGDWSSKETQSFFQRSKCALTRLSLEDISLSDEDTLALFELLPSLVDLTIHEPYQFENLDNSPIITSNVIQRLTSVDCGSSSSDSPTLFPKLERINFTVLGDTVGGTFDDRGFADMIRSRWLPDQVVIFNIAEVICLHYLKLCIVGRPLSVEAELDLMLLQQDGLCVILLEGDLETE
ncbi:hypothetical protein D9758_001585 [Tetrapyrgos nigripes]|uniref:Uncharacterized protein n=1 Tax=Tetrapyrgos nigripes TaxID=182062 RepID=A0A8H5GXK5_9AGAR|nr:hypothetical protein D9758_001585 [Tetrapyrgos nigripes]